MRDSKKTKEYFTEKQNKFGPERIFEPRKIGAFSCLELRIHFDPLSNIGIPHVDAFVSWIRCA
jgi:hypothetical protein